MGGVPVHASVTVPITIPQFPDSNTIDSDSDEDDDTMRFKFQGFRGTEEDVERIIELVEYNFIKVSKHFEDSESRDKATAALPLCNTGGDAKEFLKKLPRGKRTSWTSLCEELRSRFPRSDENAPRFGQPDNLPNSGSADGRQRMHRYQIFKKIEGATDYAGISLEDVERNRLKGEIAALIPEQRAMVEAISGQMEMIKGLIEQFDRSKAASQPPAGYGASRQDA
ncbi:MAG: hypothetical protein L6R38_009755, partial [Xanthoria sp. 2 TBL-2021]